MIQQLNANPHIRPLSSNPLLLSMICWVVDEGIVSSLPLTRAELYNKIVQKLLVRDPTFPGNTRQSASLDPSDQQSILEYSAFQLFSSTPEQRQLTFDSGTILKTIREAAKSKELTLNNNGVDLLNDLKISGLLRGDTEQGYFFLHLTIQEFLAASALAKMAEESELKWESEIKIGDKKYTLSQLVTEKAQDVRWQEVISLFAEKLNNVCYLLKNLSQKITKLPLSLVDFLVFRIIRNRRSELGEELWQKWIQTAIRLAVCSRHESLLESLLYIIRNEVRSYNNWSKEKRPDCEGELLSAINASRPDPEFIKRTGYRDLLGKAARCFKLPQQFQQGKFDIRYLLTGSGRPGKSGFNPIFIFDVLNIDRLSYMVQIFEDTEYVLNRQPYEPYVWKMPRCSLNTASIAELEPKRVIATLNVQINMPSKKSLIFKAFVIESYPIDKKDACDNTLCFSSCISKIAASFYFIFPPNEYLCSTTNECLYRQIERPYWQASKCEYRHTKTSSLLQQRSLIQQRDNWWYYCWGKNLLAIGPGIFGGTMVSMAFRFYHDQQWYQALVDCSPKRLWPDEYESHGSFLHVGMCGIVAYLREQPLPSGVTILSK